MTTGIMIGRSAAPLVPDDCWSCAAIARWQLPYYPDVPIRDRDDVLRLFSWLDEGVHRQLSRWPGDTIILASSRTGIEELMQTLGERLACR